MFKGLPRSRGYALPTILILSIVLLALGLSLFQLGTATVRSLQDQNWNRLAKEAGQAGVAYAVACLETSPTPWPAALSPSKDCSGAPASPSRIDYVIQNASLGTGSSSVWRSTFTAAVPTAGADGITRSQIVGKVELTNSLGAIVFKTYTARYNAVLSIGPSGPPANPQAIQISTSNQANAFSCLININQLAYCSGYNANGQLGNSSTAMRLNPAQFGGTGPTAGKTFAQISAGGSHTCALTTDQQAFCSGLNTSGQLGNGNTTSQQSPVQFNVAGKNFSQVAAGLNHSCALTTDLQVYCAGNNGSGQIGNGTATAQYTAPTQFGANAGSASAGKSFIQVATGLNHTCAVSSDLLVYCAGQGNSGQLGQGVASGSTSTVKFNTSGSFTSKTFTQVSAGDAHTCAVSTDLLVFCAGSNVNGRLGDTTTTSPRLNPVAFGATIGKTYTQVAAGGSAHTCALTTDLLIYCAGNNATYQLGDNTTTARSTAVKFGDLSPPTIGKTYSQVTVGFDHSCGLGDDQVVYCSGSNTTGQQGDGTVINSTKPDTSMIFL